MTTYILDRSAHGGAASTFATTLGTISRDAPELIGLWRMRVRTRAALASLPAERLDDLGLTARDVATEIAKPFWKR